MAAHKLQPEKGVLKVLRSWAAHRQGPLTLSQVEALEEMARSRAFLLETLEWLLGPPDECRRCSLIGQPCVGHDAIARARGTGSRAGGHVSD